jgi:hypothetical protein
MNNEKYISFNTGAHYTAHGQRIAATQLDSWVYMVDIDRGLDYWYKGIEFTRQGVMNAYLNNRHEYKPWEESHSALRRNLEIVAENVKHQS